MSHRTVGAPCEPSALEVQVAALTAQVDRLTRLLACADICIELGRDLERRESGQRQQAAATRTQRRHLSAVPAAGE